MVLIVFHIKERRLRVFKNKMLRGVFAFKREEVTGGWGKLQSKELHNLYSSQSIIRVFKKDKVGGRFHSVM